jgi:hypothetical protein
MCLPSIVASTTPSVALALLGVVLYLLGVALCLLGVVLFLLGVALCLLGAADRFLVLDLPRTNRDRAFVDARRVRNAFCSSRPTFFTLDRRRRRRCE